jgi:deazaflavin-dependent oxidoreductase (nitroreductase family)
MIEAARRPRRMSVRQMKILKALMGPFSRWQARRYLKSQGRSMGTLQGRDICVVTMRGAKTGRTRHVPLMYVPHAGGEGVVLVASLGGAPKHPTWYYNLLAHPDVDVQVKDRSLALRARLATPAEKAAVWPQCVKHYPDYQVYQDRTTRDIPVFLCESRPA